MISSARVRRLVPLASLLLGLAGVGCGDSNTPGGGTRVTCDAIPACYADALAALASCAFPSALTLSAGAPSSGVYSDVSCSAGDLRVELSSFSESLSGTVPTPSSVDFLQGGAPCASLGFGSGSTNGVPFELTTFEVPGAGDVSVDLYADGSMRIRCGAGDEYDVAAGALDACPSAVVTGAVTRDADLTQLDVLLVDAAGGEEALVTCQ